MRHLALLALLLPLGACRGAYYGTLEKFGIQKRHILVDRVEEGRAAQRAAKEQFQSALEAFREVSRFEGGDLEDLYDRLVHEYAESEGRVEAVRERVDAIEKVAGDLFDEWEDELGQIQDQDLRRKSEHTMRETRERYAGLLDAMRGAERKMEPVLAVLKDHVLFLKHNLNAEAIASLQGSLVSIEDDVAALIREMEASIAEADAFIAAMEGGK
jgi:hypothetical protein